MISSNGQTFEQWLQSIETSQSPIIKMVNPDTEEVFKINADTRLITVPTSFRSIGTWHEHNAETIYFEIDRYFDGVDLCEDMLCAVMYKCTASGDTHFRQISMAVSEENDKKITVAWKIDDSVTSVRGTVEFALTFFKAYLDGDIRRLSYRFNTKKASFTVADTFDFSQQQLEGATIDIHDPIAIGIQSLIDNLNSTKVNIIADISSAIGAANEVLDELKSTTSASNFATKNDVNKALENYDTSEAINIKLEDYALKSALENFPLKTDLNNYLTIKSAEDTYLKKTDKVEITIDSTLNKESSNPVENKIIATELENIENKFNDYATTDSLDGFLTEESADAKYLTKDDKIEIEIDSELNEISENPVQNKTIAAKIKELETKTPEIDLTAIESRIGNAETNILQQGNAIGDLQNRVGNLEQDDGAAVSEYDVEYGSIENEDGSTTENVFRFIENGEVKKQFQITGGGGGSSTSTTMTIERITPSPTAALSGSDVIIEFNYDSVDASNDYAGGTATWKLNNRVIATQELIQGKNSFDVTQYLNIGTHKLNLSVQDDAGTIGTKSWNIQIVDIRIESNFNDNFIYNAGEQVLFTYIPYGALSKTIHFILDGKELPSDIKSASGVQQSYTLPAQGHGAHLLETYITAEINGLAIETDHIFKDIITAEAGNPNVIIASSIKREVKIKQYDTLKIPYVVYDPTTETPKVRLYENGSLVSEIQMSGREEVWNYKSAEIGIKTLIISCGEASVILTVEVEELGININPVLGGLAFDFNPSGKTNNSAEDRNWTSNNIALTVSDNFDWINGGYQVDNNNDTYFCVKSGTKAYIDYDMFYGTDPKQNGREFKLVYKITNVKDKDTTAIQCFDESNNVGFRLQSHNAYVSSSAGTLDQPLSEEDIIEYEFNLKQSTSDISMVLTYEDGCPGRPMIYDSAHSFVHNNKQKIEIGSNDCDIHIYRMKAYNNELTNSDVLSNFIADARNAEEMLNRYYRNQIYNASGELTPQSVANATGIRVIVISAPKFTNDKKDKIDNTTIQCYYTGGSNANIDNWVCTGAKHFGQGTSSNWYGFAGRNIDLDMTKGTFYAQDELVGSDSSAMPDGVYLSPTSIPTKYLNIKVNIASSENANNALLAKRYQRFLDYATAAQKRDERAKNTLEFYNCIVFVQETDPDVTTHREFADTNIHFYAIGNIGDSKKTDGTRVSDPDDPKEFCVEITDYDVPLANFPANTVMEVSRDQNDDGTYVYLVKDNLQFFYEDIDGELVKTSDEDIDLEKIYYWDVLEAEQFNDTLSYDMRYGEASEENQKVWRDFYKFVTRDLTTNGIEDSEKIAAWKEEFKDWFIFDSALQFYLFTLHNTMVDNRAKNTFWHYGKCLDGKYRFEFWGYDFDTALGIDNAGKLRITYGVEEMDIDPTTNNTYFRAGDSLFFTRVAKYFASELTNAYNEKIDASCWNAENAIQEFDNWQNQFPEEIWRLDYERKYERTYIGQIKPGQTELTKDEQFLRDMMNGRKKYQRRQFLRDQQIYMASKFPRTSGAENIIQLRCSAPQGVEIKPDYTMHITPYSDMYITVLQGQKMVNHTRAKAGQEYAIQVAPENTTAIDFIYIYSANRIQSLGDMSKLYLQFCSIGNATKLQELKLGNNDPRYSNTALKTLGIGSNTLLETVDLTNVTALEGSLDFSKCPHLRVLEATGTNVGGVTFAPNGEITTAHLPAVSALVMKNLQYLTDLTLENYDALQSLTVENCNIDTYDLAAAAKNLRQIRMTGIDWPYEKDINNSMNILLQRLYSIRGIDTNGFDVPDSVLSGQVKLFNAYESLVNMYHQKWNNLIIAWEGSFIHQYKVDFKNDDGTILYSMFVNQGENAQDPIAAGLIPIPTKVSTAQYDFTFDKWIGNFNQITEDREIIASYTSKVREYTVNFKVNGTIRETYTIPYGGSAKYAGNIPTDTSSEDHYIYKLFKGWSANTDYITGDITVEALWETHNGKPTKKDIGDMSITELYAVTKQANRTTYFNDGDKISITLGNIPTYENITEHIWENLEFDGSTYVDTGIELFKDNRSWTLLMDLEFMNDSGTSMIASCYNSARGAFLDAINLGLRVSAANKANPQIYWQAVPAQISFDTSKATREIFLIKHIEGENELHIYRHNRYSLDPPFETVVSATTPPEEGTTLIFGGLKNYSTGQITNYAKGKIYYAKLWDAALAEESCKEAIGWIHDTINFSCAGTNRMEYIDAAMNTNLATASFIADTLLDQPRRLHSVSTNVGGYGITEMNTWLEQKFYPNIPLLWRQLIKNSIVKSNTGGLYDNVQPDYNIKSTFTHIYLPAIGDLSSSALSQTANGTQREIYQEEINASIDKISTITFITDETSRIRKMQGVATNYFTRSPDVSLYAPTQQNQNSRWYWIQSNGTSSSTSNSGSQQGVLICFSI